MGTREAQITLKTEERDIRLELGGEGKFTVKSSGWDENRVSLRATSSRSQSGTAAGCSRTCPRARDRRPNFSDTISRATETASPTVVTPLLKRRFNVVTPLPWSIDAASMSVTKRLTACAC